MKSLVLGASGATGRLLVEELLKQKQKVKVIVRSTRNIPEHWCKNANVKVIEGSISDMSVDEMAEILNDCQSVASCLGHNISFKGIYGHPRKLVRDAVKLACESIKANSPSTPIKFVLMNTSGNANRDLKESNPLQNRIVIGLLRLLLPPHPDNEKAADYLRVNIGQDDQEIQWVAVRPDGLIDEDKVSDYDLHPSPIRNPIFDAGKTSRINVANLMARLMTEELLWQDWKGQMPLIYNSTTV